MDRTFTRRTALRLGLASMGAAGLAACGVTQTSTPDIVDTAVSAGQFTTLVAAVQAAGLVETLKSPGPFTVFAPTDDAFAALPAGRVDSLLLPENREQLTQILTYHVVPGRFPASSLVDVRGSLTTAEGSTLSVDGTDGVLINGTSVITPDVTASNGIIHVIDGVLLPG